MPTRNPIHRWGRDHWTVLLLIETICVDKRGEPDLRRFRTNPARHPGLLSPDVRIAGGGWEPKYATRLRTEDGLVLGSQPDPDHDDWDCVEDLVEAGMVVWGGTGMHPIFQLTDSGWDLAGRLRRHRAEQPSTVFTADVCADCGRIRFNDPICSCGGKS